MRRLLLIFLSAVFVFAADTIVTVNGRAITDDIVPGYSKLDKQKQELIKEQLINEE